MTNTTDSQSDEYSLDARFDRVPTTGRHILWIAVLGVTYFVETFENIVFGFLAPSIRAEFGLSIAQVGLIASTAFIGLFIGALVGGRLSDRFGRRPMLIGAALLFSIGSLMAAMSPTWELLAAARLITGVGVQAAVGVLMVLVSEMFPSAERGRFFTVLTFIGFVGGPATSFIALAIVPAAPNAWRWVFVIGGVGLVIALLVIRFIPETVRWQVAHNRTAAATRTVVALERAALKKGKILPTPAATPDIVPSRPLRELFRGQALRRFIVVTVSFSIYLFCLAGFTPWIPTILTDRGMAQQTALQFTTIVTLASIFAPIVVYPFADKVERKTLIFCGGLITAAAVVVFALVDDPLVSVVAAFIAQLGLSSMTISFYTYIPEVFPTALRGVGGGAVYGVGRIAGVISGVAVAAMYAGWGFQTYFLALAALYLLCGAILLVFGARTAKRSLENIAEDEPAKGANASGKASAENGTVDIMKPSPVD
jgi:putative MFS transporter